MHVSSGLNISTLREKKLPEKQTQARLRTGGGTTVGACWRVSLCVHAPMSAHVNKMPKPDRSPLQVRPKTMAARACRTSVEDRQKCEKWWSLSTKMKAGRLQGREDGRDCHEVSSVSADKWARRLRSECKRRFYTLSVSLRSKKR